MNDFDGLLGTEFGLKPQGKSAPMTSKGSSNFTKTSSLNFDSGSRSSRSSNQDSSPFADLFNLDSVYRSSSTEADFASKSVNSPVYDDDIFDGLKKSSKVSHDNGGSAHAFDDILGGFGQSKKPVKDEKGVADFDDLIPGFGNSKRSGERCGYCAFLLF